jgi:hypothetical protein
MKQRFFDFFSSLTLTVGLLAAASLLVFFGTLHQVDFGIYETQRQYFQSWIVIWHYPLVGPGSAYLSWVRIPLLGGYTVGVLLMVNLIGGFVRHFIFAYKKMGLYLIHLGVLLLIMSGFISSALQQESQMAAYEGVPAYYSESIRENELVLIDTTSPDYDHVISFSEKLLQSSKSLKHVNLPFEVHVQAFFSNSVIGHPQVAATAMPFAHTVDQGIGLQMGLQIFPVAVNYKPEAINTASAYVTLKDKDHTIGTWLVSNVFDDQKHPQSFSYQGKHYDIALRFKRFYNSYSLTLLKFKHDTYPGSDIPKNFSSLLRIRSIDTSEERDAFIYMNHPLRYKGQTFYQASFTPDGKASILQVVRNPGWWLPYICIALVGVGLVMHFIIQLTYFLTKRK